MHALLALLLAVPCQNEIDNYIKWAESKRPAYVEPETDRVHRHEHMIRVYKNEIQRLQSKAKSKTKPKNKYVTDEYLGDEKELRQKIAREQSEVDTIKETIREKNKKPYLPPPTDKPTKGRYTTIKGRVLKANEKGYALIELPSEQIVAVKGLNGLIDGQTLQGNPFIHFNEEVEVNGKKILTGYYLDKDEVMRAYKSFMDKKDGKARN